jgi:hypothetical protein
LFSATRSGSFWSGPGRRQVRKRCICLRGQLCGHLFSRRRGLGGRSSRVRFRTGGFSPGRWLQGCSSRARIQPKLHRACSPDNGEVVITQVGKSKIFKRPKKNSQCQLLFGGLLHPPAPSRSICCRWRGSVGRLRGPCHGNSHCIAGGWARLHPFELGPRWQSRETISGHCKYSASLILSNSPKQQFDTWRTRLLAPCVCALAAGPLAPEVERRPTPRSGRRSYPGAVPLRLLLPHASPRIRRTRCCLGPWQGEPSWLPWQQQGAVLLRLLLPPASPRVRRPRCCLELQQGEPP